MNSNSNIIIGGLKPHQYHRLMSPARRETNSRGELTGRKISWIQCILKRIPVFFHRVSHLLFHSGHKWENDKSLFQKLKNGLHAIRKMDPDKIPEIKRIAQEIILRNPRQDKACIEDKITHFEKVKNPDNGDSKSPPKKETAEGNDSANASKPPEKKTGTAERNNRKRTKTKVSTRTPTYSSNPRRHSQTPLKSGDSPPRHNNFEDVRKKLQKQRNQDELPASERGKRDTFSEKDRDKAFKLTHYTADPKVLKENRRQEDNPPKNKLQRKIQKQIALRREEIRKTTAAYEPEIEKDKKEHPERYSLIEECLKTGFLKTSSHGSSGLRYLQNKEGEPLMVIKPHDEGLYCLNNGKIQTNEALHSRFGVGERVRHQIPLYFEVLSEVLFYKVSELLGLEDYVPETFPVLITSDSFFDRKEDPHNPQPKTKLCSAQIYKDSLGFTSDAALEPSDPEYIDPLSIDFYSIAASLFLDCLCGNADRNDENCLVCSQDTRQGTRNVLINIDHGLCFPEGNEQVRIFTVKHLPQAAKQPFPDTFKELIEKLADENHELSQKLFDMVEKEQLKHAKATLPLFDKKKPQDYVAPEDHIKSVIGAMKDRIKMIKWAIDRNMSMEEVCCRVIALHETDLSDYPYYAYREETLLEKDVPTWNVGKKEEEEERLWNQLIPARMRRMKMMKQKGKKPENKGHKMKPVDTPPVEEPADDQTDNSGTAPINADKEKGLFSNPLLGRGKELVFND